MKQIRAGGPGVSELRIATICAADARSGGLRKLFAYAISPAKRSPLIILDLD